MSSYRRGQTKNERKKERKKFQTKNERKKERKKKVSTTFQQMKYNWKHLFSLLHRACC